MERGSLAVGARRPVDFHGSDPGRDPRRPGFPPGREGTTLLRLLAGELAAVATGGDRGLGRGRSRLVRAAVTPSSSALSGFERNWCFAGRIHEARAAGVVDSARTLLREAGLDGVSAGRSVGRSRPRCGRRWGWRRALMRRARGAAGGRVRGRCALGRSRLRQYAGPRRRRSCGRRGRPRGSERARPRT